VRDGDFFKNHWGNCLRGDSLAYLVRLHLPSISKVEGKEEEVMLNGAPYGFAAGAAAAVVGGIVWFLSKDAIATTALALVAGAVVGYLLLRKK